MTIEIPSNGSGGSDDLLQLLDPFEGDCPSAIDFCDDVFDLLVGEDDSEAPVLDLEGDVPFDCTFERSSSCGIGTNRNKEDNLVSLTSQNSAEDDCIAVLLLPGKDLEGEGQGENFVPWAQNVQGIVEKKRKRVSSRDAEDAKLDEAARKLEAALDKLERDNKQLMSCFVTLGEQMKTMMNENKQLKSVLACYNDGMNGRQNAPSKSCHHKAENISPTVQLLAQVALLSGSLAK